MRLRSVRLSLPALLLLSLSAFAGPPSEIKFGIFATEAWETLKPNWEPFLAAQSAATGLRVSAYYAPTYEALVDALSRNEVQIAWLGNKSAIEAAGRANSEVFAQIAKKDGETAYYSQLPASAKRTAVHQTAAAVHGCRHPTRRVDMATRRTRSAPGLCSSPAGRGPPATFRRPRSASTGLRRIDVFREISDLL